MSIFFKSAMIYRLTQEVPQFGASGNLGAQNWQIHEELNKALNQRAARTPGPMELTTLGWTEPYPNSYRTLADVNTEPTLEEAVDEPFLPRLVRPVANGQFLIVAMQEQYRQLPGAVVRNAIHAKVSKIEQEQLRKVYKKERDQLKDEVVTQLLPQAFVLYRNTYAMIDTQEGLIWVQTTSPKKAEALLSLLREALGSLPVRPLHVKVAPSAAFTDWVKTSKSPEDFYLLDSLLMEDTHEDGGKVAAMRQDLTSESILQHVSEGKLVTKIAVAWKDQLGFVINDKVQFTKIRFSDYMEDKAGHDAGQDTGMEALCEASYFLMGHALRDMLNQLLPHLGGEEVPQGI